MATVDQTFARLQKSTFRARFRLTEKDRQYIIYRFSAVFTKRTGLKERLIVCEGGGYRRNPDLRIMTDITEFDACLLAAKSLSDKEKKAELLRKAVDLYKGSVFMSNKDSPWLNEIAFHYEARYIKATEALLHELADQCEYGAVLRYASKTLELYPGNGMIVYWFIVATFHLSGSDMAKAEYFWLQKDMTQEEIAVVKKHLKENRPIQYEELNGT